MARSRKKKENIVKRITLQLDRIKFDKKTTLTCAYIPITLRLPNIDIINSYVVSHGTIGVRAYRKTSQLIESGKFSITEIRDFSKLDKEDLTDYNLYLCLVLSDASRYSQRAKKISLLQNKIDPIFVAEPELESSRGRIYYSVYPVKLSRKVDIDFDYTAYVKAVKDKFGYGYVLYKILKHLAWQ